MEILVSNFWSLSKQCVCVGGCGCGCVGVWYVCVCVLWYVCVLSRVLLIATPWTVVSQAPLSMEFPRLEYWSGCHFLLQGIFLTQGSHLHLLNWQADSSLLVPPGKPFSSRTSTKSMSCLCPRDKMWRVSALCLWILVISIILFSFQLPILQLWNNLESSRKQRVGFAIWMCQRDILGILSVMKKCFLEISLWLSTKWIHMGKSHYIPNSRSECAKLDQVKEAFLIDSTT